MSTPASIPFPAKLVRKQGFTLVELLIVVTIVAIIAALAIPNLLSSRLVANEATAVTTLKAYTVAQSVFLSGRQGRSTTNTNSGNGGYCDNFRNLYYGVQVNTTINLALITQNFADAFARTPGPMSAATNNSPTVAATMPQPYQGYLFGEPVEMLTGSDNKFKNDFALMAVPMATGQSGVNAYWIGQQGTVMMTAVPIALNYSASILMQSPCDPTVPAGVWMSL